MASPSVLPAVQTFLLIPEHMRCIGGRGTSAPCLEPQSLIQMEECVLEMEIYVTLRWRGGGGGGGAGWGGTHYLRCMYVLFVCMSHLGSLQLLDILVGCFFIIYVFI